VVGPRFSVGFEFRQFSYNSAMTSADVVNLAVETFRNNNFDKPPDGDRFFEKYGVGNNTIRLDGPFERFNHYKDLLAALRAADEQKFGVIHKGTPLYFLSWLAFDLRRFEAALHFLDAAIAEDKRKDPSGWFNNPGPQFLVLNPSHAAKRTVEALSDRIGQELQRFEQQYHVKFSRDDFIRRFAEPMMKGGNAAVAAAFYVFVLEFDDHVAEVSLRSAPVLGSYQPLFVHLFKGGLLLETLLKLAFPQVVATNPKTTLGTLLQHNDFRARFGFNPSSIADVTVTQLCSDATDTKPETAFQTTGRLRNMAGHNLVRDPLPSVPRDFVTLASQEINAFLYALLTLYP